MGLSLSVGLLVDLLVHDEEGGQWLESEIANLNETLLENGLKLHVEPRALEHGTDFSCDMWSYSGLHYLRRLAVHLAPKKSLLGMRKGKLPPPIVGGATEDPILKKRYAATRIDRDAPFQHFLDHSDAEGFYVPQDFSSVLVNSKVAGAFIGSTPRLRAECEIVAKALGVDIGLDPESDEVAEAAEASDPAAEGWKAYGIETYCCLQLLRACEASMKSGALLVFT